MDQQINLLQSSIDEKNTLITRLRAESQAADRNVAVKTNMLTTAEIQAQALNKEIIELKNEIIQKDKSQKLAVERVIVVEEKLKITEMELVNSIEANRVMCESNELKEIDTIKNHEIIIADIKAKYDEKMDTIKKENTRKSSLARTLLTEREEENNFLKAKNEELVSEIKSGAPSERRIFELAEVQAKREAVHGLHG